VTFTYRHYVLFLFRVVCILEEESSLARICEYSDINLLKYSIILTSGKFWEQLEIQHDRSLLKGVYGVYRDMVSCRNGNVRYNRLVLQSHREGGYQITHNILSHADVGYQMWHSPSEGIRSSVLFR